MVNEVSSSTLERKPTRRHPKGVEGGGGGGGEVFHWPSVDSTLGTSM